MSVDAKVINTLIFSGDQQSELIYDSGTLEDSPYMQEVVTLTLGQDTELTPPDVEGFTVHGLAIVPPTGTDETLLLKGNAADIGIYLSTSQATVIQFGPLQTTPLILHSVVNDIVGVRLVWF